MDYRVQIPEDFLKIFHNNTHKDSDAYNLQKAMDNKKMSMEEKTNSEDAIIKGKGFKMFANLLNQIRKK